MVGVVALVMAYTKRRFKTFRASRGFPKPLKMSCGRAWSARFNKSEMKLNVREIEWKSLMNECLMETEIINDKSEECSNVDPNSAMDFRHKMVRESSKISSMAQLQTQTEALKLLRIRNHNRMLKQKEGRMVEKEITRLKETLENNRSLIQEKLHEATKKKAKSSQNAPKFVRYYAKHYKKLELCDGVCEVDTWLSRSVRMQMETKINHQGIPFDVKVTVKRREESVGPAPTPERSATPDETERDEFINEDENELVLFQKTTEELSDFKNAERNREILEMQKRTDLRIVSHSWKTWKVYTQQRKSRKKEKRIFNSKIEAFLSNLQDRRTREAAGKINNTKWRSECGASEKKEKFLKKLMEEVKTSRTEAYQKLREITKVPSRENPQNLEFLRRIEERREERLKRRKEIQEKKLKLAEEQKKAENQKQEEKRLKEEENERKRQEESREKRRLQAERQKQRQQEREKLRHNTKLAENHYRNHLLRSYGLRPWLRLLQIRDSQQQQALSFYQTTLTRRAFHSLMSNAREETTLKVIRANEFHEKMLKKNFLLLWVDHHNDNIKRDQVAVDWNEFKTTERAFRKWLQFTQNEQLEYLNKKDMAVLNYERILKTKYLNILRDYPNFKKLEQAKENRKRKWRQRVKEILPDYQPAETCFV